MDTHDVPARCTPARQVETIMLVGPRNTIIRRNAELLILVPTAAPVDLHLGPVRRVAARHVEALAPAIRRQRARSAPHGPAVHPLLPRRRRARLDLDRGAVCVGRRREADSARCARLDEHAARRLRGRRGRRGGSGSRGLFGSRGSGGFLRGCSGGFLRSCSGGLLRSGGTAAAASGREGRHASLALRAGAARPRLGRPIASPRGLIKHPSPKNAFISSAQVQEEEKNGGGRGRLINGMGLTVRACGMPIAA